MGTRPSRYKHNSPCDLPQSRLPTTATQTVLLQVQAAVLCIAVLAMPVAHGAGFDVTLRQQSGPGGRGGLTLLSSWSIHEGSRLLGSGNSLRVGEKQTFESQLPVTVVVFTNGDITDGYMTYRDMKRDFNQGSDHCTKTRSGSTSTTTCHFDHE